MDAVAETLQTLRFEGGVFLDAAFSEPWCVLSQVEPGDCSPHRPVPPRLVAYHYVSRGSVWLDVGDGAPVQVGAGHLIVLPRNDVHRLGSDLAQPALPAETLIRPGGAGSLARIAASGDEATRILCGYLGADVQAGPLLDALPAVMTVAIGDAVTASWIETTLRFAARQSSDGVDGLDDAPATLAQIATLLFTTAVRRYVAEQTVAAPSWLAAMRDPMVARALAHLHAHPDDAWTTPRLARATATSRTVLHERFVKAMGVPPMRYLAQRRLARAAERLRSSPEPIAGVALACGYGSEAAFTRAFKRVYGTPPAAWRRAHGMGG
jgi:AraC-like DNA-binding protein